MPAGDFPAHASGAAPARKCSHTCWIIWHLAVREVMNWTMYKKCPGFFEQKSPKTGKFGYQMQKNPQCPKIGEILGTGEKSPGSCPNGPGPDGISMSAGTASGLLIVGQLQLIKHVEYQAKDHSGDAGQHHTGKLHISKLHGNSRQSCDKYD